MVVTPCADGHPQGDGAKSKNKNYKDDAWI